MYEKEEKEDSKGEDEGDVMDTVGTVDVEVEVDAEDVNDNGAGGAVANACTCNGDDAEDSTDDENGRVGVLST